ncbi:MAG: DUF4349 domain-containing protein [Phycisphaeraceae bacterium]
MRHVLILSLSFVLLLLVACGAEEEAMYETSADYAMSPADSEAGYAVYETGVASDRAENGSNAAPTALNNQPASQRKIIFTAEVRLVVDEFAGVTQQVSDLAKRHNGFIARSSIQGSEGEPRRGEWTLRIPSTQYDAFLQGSQKLGQVRSVSSDSQEVTAEYVDIEARLRNLIKEETRLHAHLNESTKSLKDILAVEREIARVRGDIERFQGRLNVLKDLTSLSTVTLSIEEIKDYIPEPTEEPGYATQIGRTWSDSLGAVGGFFTNASLVIVAFIPWLAVILPIGFVSWLILRRLKGKLYKPLGNTK